MWNRFLIVWVIFATLAGCATGPVMQQNSELSASAKRQQINALTDAQRYFLEIALRSEYGNADPLVRRWERPVRLYVDGDRPTVLLAEADSVLNEIKQLAPHLDIAWVDQIKDANVKIFFGPYKEYSAKYAPSSRDRLRRNWGYFTVQWFTSGNGIESASMYVDTRRTRDDETRRHLLREELTQLFGLMADSNRYPDSIFYQRWSTTTQYSDLDRQLIKMLYDQRLHSGMDEQAIRAVWQAKAVGKEANAGDSQLQGLQLNWP